jgi:NAD(P)-dependent dehydrogenase (short-subunit alcohol dehydrogenase family)
VPTPARWHLHGDQVQQALADLPDTVDVLVNNAGGNADIGAPEPATLSEVAAAWRANLDASILPAVLVTTALRDRLSRGGAVISFIGAHGAGAVVLRSSPGLASKPGTSLWRGTSVLTRSRLTSWRRVSSTGPNSSAAA